MLKLKEISKIYQVGDHRIYALHQVNLAIGEGEFVTVMGPSGSGKSTMMNILGCLDKPTEGEYLLDGIEVSTLGSNELAVLRNQKMALSSRALTCCPGQLLWKMWNCPCFMPGSKAKNGGAGLWQL